MEERINQHPSAQSAMKDPVRLGVSSCLLGRPVRFDGGHKKSRFFTEDVDRYVEWVSLCPEVDAGLTAPRPALRLVRREGAQAIETSADGIDLTDKLSRWSNNAVERLTRADLDGYVLMQGSPSCGLERVRVYEPSGQARRDGRGVFAAALVAAMPDLPVEEEGRLRDPRLREAFFERVFALRRLRALVASDPAPTDLVAFHARHKLQLMSHSPSQIRALGRVVASAGRDLKLALTQYATLFPKALSISSSRGKHVNALEHGAGHLKKVVGRTARHDLLETVRAYANETLPLVVPVTLLSHQARSEEITYLTDQTYLMPYPDAMGLRNAV